MKNKLLLSLSLILFISTQVYALGVPSPQLGYGYSTDNNQSTQEVCLHLAAPTYSNSNTGLVELNKLYDLNEMKQQLDFKADTHFTIGFFEASAAADFMHYMENDNLSESLIYRTTYSFKDMSAAPKAIFGSFLDKTGSDQWKAGPQQFRTACGDSYVSQMHTGAYLYIVYQFDFSNAIDKQNFDATFGASYASLGQFSAELKKQSSSLHIHGAMHVMAYQTGGDPTQLGTIFKAPFPWQPSPISLCSFSNLQACSQLMDGIINYVSNPKTGFPSQLQKMSPGNKIPDLAAVTGIETADYSHLDPKLVTQSIITPAITTARDNLGTYLDTTTTHLQRAEYIQGIINYPFIYDDYKAELSSYIDTLKTNQENLQTGGMSCFNTPQTCVATSESTIRSLNPDDGKALTMPQRFEISQTIAGNTSQLLMAEAPTSPPAGQQLFYGTQTAPTQTGEYDVSLSNDGSTIYMILRDHTTQAIIASYQGQFMGGTSYQGTFTLTAGGSGTWTGSLIKPTSYTVNKS